MASITVPTADPSGCAPPTAQTSGSGHSKISEHASGYCPPTPPCALFENDGVAPVTIVFDERMLLHVTAPMDDRSKVMPEQAVRILSIFHRLRCTGVLMKSDLRIVPSCFAADADLLRVHTPELLARVRQCDKRADAEVDVLQGRMHLDAALARRFHLQPSRMVKWALELDDRDIFDWSIHPFQDTYAGPYTPSVAQLAAGGAIRAVDAVVRDGSVNAFAIIRPPGHHCQTHAAGGFCFYNNVAVAARYAQATYGIKRVAIVDFDVHHGDGTQDVFKADPSVLFISLHRYGNAFYPCTGDASEVGTGAGEGFSLNIPFGAAGLGEVEYSAMFERIVLPVLAEFNPDMIMVSAGFDAAEGGPTRGHEAPAVVIRVRRTHGTMRSSY
jgi:acetoin utilization deacetylase AcuC-like enzyme